MMEMFVGAALVSGVIMLRHGLTVTEAAVWLAVRLMAAVMLMRWSAEAALRCMKTRWPEAITEARRKALYL